MENLVISFNTVAPMFLLMCIGQSIKKLKIVSLDAFNQLNRAVFFFFMPAMVFHNIYEGELSAINSPALLIFCSVGSVLGFFVGILFSRRFDENSGKRSVVTFAFFRTNTMIMGLPIATALFDEVTPMIVTFVVAAVTNNLLSAFVMAKGERSKGGIVLAAFKNPLLVAALLGLGFNLLHIPLPVFIRSTVGTMGDMTGGLAMITLGASLSFKDLRRNGKLLGFMCVLRLVVIPAVALSLAAFMGFRGIEMLSVLIFFGSAFATLLFTLTCELGDDAEFAGELVMVSHLFGFLTLFLWIFLLKSTGLM